MRRARRRCARTASDAVRLAAALSAGALALAGCGDDDDPPAAGPERTLALRSDAGTVRADYLGGCVFRQGSGVCPRLALRPAAGPPLRVRPGETVVVRGRPHPTELRARYAARARRRGRTAALLERDVVPTTRKGDAWLVDLGSRLERIDHLVLHARYADGDGTFVVALRAAGQSGGTGAGGNRGSGAPAGCGHDPPRSREEQLAEAIRTRRQLGFRSDSGYVLRLVTDPPPGVSCAQLGVPLTAAEQRDLRERLPFPDRLRVTRARFSKDHLVKLKDRISADLDDLQSEGYDVRTVGVDISGNRVSVGMANPSERAARQLRERYGPAVRVMPGRVVPELRTDVTETKRRRWRYRGARRSVHEL